MVHLGEEACDDGNNEAGDGCSPQCVGELPPNCLHVLPNRLRYTFICDLSHNHDQARSHCQRGGADLVTPINRTDNRALYQAVQDSNLGGDFWLGYVDPDGRGNQSGAYVGIQSNQTFWARGSPYDGSRSCARYRSRDNNDGWHDRGCGWNYRFICEVQP